MIIRNTGTSPREAGTQSLPDVIKTVYKEHVKTVEWKKKSHLQYNTLKATVSISYAEIMFVFF